MNRLTVTAAAATLAILVLAGCTTTERIPLDPQAQVPPPQGNE